MALKNFLAIYEIGYKSLFNYRRALRFDRIMSLIDGCSEERSARRILDVGCGTGAYSIFLQHKGYDVVGVDIDEEKINTGKKFSKGIDLRLGSVLALPFNNSEFDLVLMTEVLEHIKEPQRAISEINRVLKSKGILVLSVPTKKYSKSFDDSDYHEKAGYDIQELAELVSGKFQIESCEKSGFLAESAIKQIDFNLLKEKGFSYVGSAGKESIAFKLYKYVAFPICCFVLGFDKFCKVGEGLNIIAVCKKT